MTQEMEKTLQRLYRYYSYVELNISNTMLYCFWDMVFNRCNCYFSFWATFCQKNEKTPGDIIILHMSTKNYELYSSWDMVRDGCNYFSFWAILCPFTPLTAQKFKFKKKWKNSLEISSFYTIVPKIMIICYTVSEIWCMTDVIVIFHFGLFFVLLTQKIKY